MQASNKQTEGPRRRGASAQGLAGYLSDDGGGGSTFGIMCERVDRDRWASRPCRECRGTGWRELTEQDLRYRASKLATETNPDKLREIRNTLIRDSDCRECKGVGYLARKLRESATECPGCDGFGCIACNDKGTIYRQVGDKTWSTVRCNKCKGCGEVMNEDLGDVCQRCFGDMCVVPWTVKPTGGSTRGGSPLSVDAEEDGDELPEPDDTPTYSIEQSIVARGKQSRIMTKLKAQNEPAAAVLAAYYGPTGDKYAAHRWGRYFAVWPLTKPGADLARSGAERSKLGHGFLLDALSQIASERNAEDASTVPNFRRRGLMREADRLSRQMVAEAHRALNRVTL